MANEYQSGFTGEQVDEAVAYIVSGKAEEDKRLTHEAAKKAETAARKAEKSAVDSEKAKEGAEEAKTGIEEAKDESIKKAVEAKSWAVGGTGSRVDENVNNAKYWSDKAKNTANGDYLTLTEFDGERKNINYIGINPIKKPEDDTTMAWINFGSCVAAFTVDGCLQNQPEEYGFLINTVTGSYVAQDFIYIGARSTRYQRTGNRNGWYNGIWYQNFNARDVIPTSNGGIGQNISIDAGPTEHMRCCNQFLYEMNRMGSVLGMNNTVFKTVGGLTNSSTETYTPEIHNSRITAYDLVRLTIAARHAPAALEAMGRPVIEYLKNGTRHTFYHTIISSTVWKEWAENNGYSIIGAKGGSLKGVSGEIGESGISNMAMIIADSAGQQYAVGIVGLFNPQAWKSDYSYYAGDKVIEDGITYESVADDNINHEFTDEAWWKVSVSEGDFLRLLIHDLIEVQNGASETANISTAKNRRYPVGMAITKLTKNESFARDINTMKNGIFYNETESRVAASVIKIMNAIICSSFIDNNYCTVISTDLVPGSTLGWANGDLVTIYDAVSIMLMRSDNQLATMLGRVCGKRIADVQNYFPKSGGTLSGNLVIKTSYLPTMWLTNSENGKDAAIQRTSYGINLFARSTPTNEQWSGLSLHDQSTTGNIDNILQLDVRENSKSNYYIVFGEHNKPSGTYSGDGTEERRVISIGGIGNALLVTSSFGLVIVTAAGAVGKDGNSPKAIAASECTFVNGNLSFVSTNELLNSADTTYNYQVL